MRAEAVSRRDRVRTCLIGALAMCLVGCSRQSPPELALASCTGPNAPACFDRWDETEPPRPTTVAMDIKPSVAVNPISASAAQIHHRAHAAGRPVQPAAGAEPAASQALVRKEPSTARLQAE